MTQILKSGYQIQNYISVGQGVVGGGTSTDNGILTQLNQGTADTVNINNDKTGINKMWVTDASDTINLTGGGWTKGDVVTDDTTGIMGTEYDNGAGGKIVIAGGATVNISDTSTDQKQGTKADSGTTPSNPVTPLDNTPNYDPTKVQTEVVNDIKAIEKDNNVDLNGSVTKDQISKSLNDGNFTGAKKSYWQNILNQFDSLDVDSSTTGNKKDGSINALDIGPSSSSNGDSSQTSSNAFKTSNYSYSESNIAQWNASSKTYTGGDGGAQAASDSDVNSVIDLKKQNTASGGVFAIAWTALQNAFGSLETAPNSQYVSSASLFSSIKDGKLDSNLAAKQAAIAIVDNAALANNLDTASVATDDKDGLFSYTDLGIMAKQAALDENT